MPTADDLKHSMCASMIQMGDNHYQLGQVDKAIDYYRQALPMAHESGDRVSERRILVSLALSDVRKGDLSHARDHYDQARQAAPRIHDITDPVTLSNEVVLLIDLAREYYHQGDLTAACTCAESAGELAPDLKALDERSGERLEHLAQAHLAVFMMGTGPLEDAAERCRAALDYGEAAPDDGIVGAALTGLGLADVLRGAPAEASAGLTRALPKLRAAHDTLLEAEARATLRLCLAESGQPDAVLNAAAEASASLSQRAQALSSTGLGLAQAIAGQTEAALPTCHEALTLAQDVLKHGDQIGFRLAARALYGLGKTSLSAGQADEAAASLTQALAMAEESQDAPLRVQALLGLGDAQMRSSPNDARASYVSAQSAAKAIGSRMHEAQALVGLGRVTAAMAHVEDGLEYFQRALAIAAEGGDRLAQFQVHMDFADAYRAGRQPDGASAHYEEALDIAQAEGITRLEARAKGGLGLAIVDAGDQGRMAQAVQFLTEALKHVQGTGDQAHQQQYLGALGTAYSLLGDGNRAAEQYKLALSGAREAGDRIAEGVWLGNLANLYAFVGQSKRAVEAYQQAIEISRETGDRVTESRLLMNLALTYSELDQQGDAIQTLQAARAILSEIGDAALLAQADTLLGELGG